MLHLGATAHFSYTTARPHPKCLARSPTGLQGVKLTDLPQTLVEAWIYGAALHRERHGRGAWKGQEVKKKRGHLPRLPLIPGSATEARGF